MLVEKEREREPEEECHHTDIEWNLFLFFLIIIFITFVRLLANDGKLRRPKERHNRQPKWTCSFPRRKSWSSTRNWKSVFCFLFFFFMIWKIFGMTIFSLCIPLTFAFPTSPYFLSRYVPLLTNGGVDSDILNWCRISFCLPYPLAPLSFALSPTFPGNYDGSRLENHFLHCWHWRPGRLDGQAANDHSRWRGFQ